MSWILATLGILGWALAILAALLLVIILLLLFLPLDIAGRTDSDLQADGLDDELTGSLRWQATIRWGWGLFALEVAGQWLKVEQWAVRILGHRLRFRRSERAPGRKPVRKKKQRRPLTLEVIRAFIQEGLRLLRRLWANLGWRLEGDITYGFGDPSLTGICEALRHAAGLPEGVFVSPSWLLPALVGWLRFEGRIFGVELVAALLAALRNRVLRHHLFARRHSNTRGRKTPIGGHVS